MNELVKRGFSAYMIFLKNKVASSVMMLFSGVMMFIAAINNHGNDTKSLPMLITAVGTILTLWASFRLGYVKCKLDSIGKDNRAERKEEKKIIFFQILESFLYVFVAGLGVFLLVNDGFTNKVLDLMAGGFTTLNGVLGAIYVVKHKDEKDFRWKLGIVLTVIELILGPYFVFASGSINIPGYIIMGVLTSAAGVVEVISALTRENIKGAIDDSKKIVKIMKDGGDNDQTIQING